MSHLTHICHHISSASGIPFGPARVAPVHGGCINNSMVLEEGDRRYFVKTNKPETLTMFTAEAAGLSEIIKSETIHAPAPLCWGVTGESAYLVLEHIPFGGNTYIGNSRLGEALAALHRTSSSGFGWQLDNTIGTTPQVNTPTTGWADFWGRHRLGYQLTLARANGAPENLIERGERPAEAVPSFFSDYQPTPSLLHGDLWGGNWSTDTSDNPVVFDPAVYYGDREADLAMTELFGGFSQDFYSSYGQCWSLDPGYPTRRELYNLYHILNHFNLFGGGYAAQAEGMINHLLAEAGW